MSDSDKRGMDLPLIVERSLDSLEKLTDIDSPLLRRIYAGRGITSSDELDYRLEHLPHFRDLKQIGPAVALLAAAIDNGHRICVVGDFDADGATSTALVCDALAAMGATHVDYFIPHRARHGYGLSPRVVEAVGAGDTGDLIVTVDNGIAGHAGVAAAQAAGWQVLICDHHLPGETLPAADAIVNPNQPGCAFAGKALAGVGVAFYLMAALRARLAERMPGRALPQMSDYLDLVALGTVADVVRLDRINRTLISQGLRRIRAGRARPGIFAVAEVAGRAWQRLDSADIGFALAPRLNAAGRLENMAIGVECLRTSDPEQARNLAGELASINSRRRSVQERMQADAEAAVDSLAGDIQDASGITVYRQDWHQGVVGLVASRLRERHHRPVVAFAPGEHGMLKGSARSIPGLHVRDVLAAVDADNPGLIAQFGGHAPAAGLALDPAGVTQFAVSFDHAVAARMTPAMAARELLTDGVLDDNELTLNTARQLSEAGPWGAGFEEPLFHGEFDIRTQRIVGEKHLKLMVCPQDGQQTLEAMVFNHDVLLDTSRRHRLVYRLAVNVFRERVSANLIVTHLQEV